ncbi:MAG: phage virion morphogenesis protein [Proteobacteria bacterium]|nr:phage virion morphogenesis protein [Pseudomonadota bacterium]
MSIRKTGDWDKARRLLRSNSAQLNRAIGTALRQEAQLLRKEIIQGITRQAPGGESFERPSPLTLAARQMKGRGGSKALLVRGDLRNSIAVIVRGDEAFIGIPRKARDKDGQPVIDVAQVHEFGANPIVIPMTSAMRRFLFALLRKADKTPTGGSGRGVVVVSIPARPFLRPAFRQFAKGAHKRFVRRVATLLKLGDT